MNNLYGRAMCEKLPLNNFIMKKFENPKENL